MSKSKTGGVVKLSMRGKHRGERLKARIHVWQQSKVTQDNPTALHRPGSNKK